MLPYFVQLRIAKVPEDKGFNASAPEMPGKAHVLDKIMRFRLGRRHPPPEVVYAARRIHPVSIRCFSSGFRYTRQWRERGLYSLFDVGLCVCSRSRWISGGSIWRLRALALAACVKLSTMCGSNRRFSLASPPTRRSPSCCSWTVSSFPARSG